MHRFYATTVEKNVARLAADEARHLTKVLRLAVGDAVAVFDGRGHEWMARIARVAATEVLVDLIEPRPSAPESRTFVMLAVGLLKGDDMDAVVRDATALGVVAIMPFVSTRAVVPAAARQERAVERWTRVAVASAKQCGRSTVPSVHPAAPLATVFATRSTDERIVCAEPGASERSVAIPARPVRPVTLFVGPEGGWTGEELEVMTSAGARIVTLGPRTLRASLAPVVALSALWTAWEWTQGGVSPEP